MFITDDPQLPSLTTPFGFVNFLQIVGVCTEELDAAQHWNGPAVINLLKQVRDELMIKKHVFFGFIFYYGRSEGKS